MLSRPAEVSQASIGTIVGAVIILLGAFGLDVPPQVTGAVTVLVSAIAGLVTWMIARKQRAAQLGSRQDGTVTE